jgi:hypothetical protein
MSRSGRDLQPDSAIHQILSVLGGYRAQQPGAQIEAYRQNAASVWVRILDPDFKELDRVAREEMVWKILDQLPESIQTQISLLLLLTPKEAESSFANFEFDNAIPAYDILSCLPNWSARNLRWLIDYLARLNDHGGQARYTVIQKKACALRDERASTGQKVADKPEAAGRFILAGVEGHNFGRCKTSTDCYELATRMGLGIVPSSDASGYFGHAIIQEVESK